MRLRADSRRQRLRDHPPPLLRAGRLRHRRRSPWRRSRCERRVRRSARGGTQRLRPACRGAGRTSRRRRSSVIYLFMAGAPSQLDLFDYKPKLQQVRRPADARRSSSRASGSPSSRARRSCSARRYEFAQHGQSGARDLRAAAAPRRRSSTTSPSSARCTPTQFNHAPAQIFMNTGRQVIGRPSMGSWLTYGLGSENQDLPGFVVLLSGENDPDGGKSLLGQRLPADASTRACEFRSQGDPVLFVSNPDGRRRRRAARSRSTRSRDLNGCSSADVGDPEIADAHRAYELAYRMQTSVPELIDIAERAASRSSSCTAPKPGKASFANNCLLARRLVERGVRFVQLYHRGWDHHGASRRRHRRRAAAAVPRDRPAVRGADHRPQAARPARRHAGRLGRRVRPHADERGAQRLEVPRPRPPSATPSPSGWPAAASSPASPTARPTSSATTSSRTRSTSTTCTPRSCTCWASTTTKLTYRFQGRDFRLTDVHGKLVPGLIG